jgi:hypothetical protein
LNFSISDVKDIKDRARKFSKEIVLEGTSNNCAFFRSFYNFTVTDGAINFDATQKTDAILKKQGLRIFGDGVLKLNKVVINDDKIKFYTHLFSETVDYFLLLSNLRVSELDWSEYDHVLNRTNIKASWLTPSGSGYRYPLIERGNGRVGTIWNTTDIVPYVHQKEIIEKMYEYLGLTIDSSWLETTDIKNILFGYGGGDYIDNSITPLDIANRLVDLDSGDLNYTSTSNIQWGNQIVLGSWQPSLTANIATFGVLDITGADLTVVETSDLLGQYDDGLITVQKSGNYNFSLTGDLGINIDTGILTYEFKTDSQLLILRNGQLIQSINLQDANTNPSSHSVNVNINLFCQSGDEITLRLQTGGVSVSRSTANDTDTVTYELTTNTPLELTLSSIDENITDGGTVSLSKFIPDMLCSDFLIGFIRHFNLYTSDPDEKGVVEIRPFTQYYTNTNDFDDISEDVDRNKDITIKPIANEYGKIFSFRFKQNKDRDAIVYFESWGEQYGDYLHEQGSFFAKGEEKIQLPWSTIVPYQIENAFLIPRYISEDNSGAIKGNKGAARVCFWNGLKAGDWTFRNTDDPTQWEALTTYPCIHHFNDWETPTFDLNFKLVNEVMYSATIVTTSNCFSEYYSIFTNELTNRAGQLVTLSVKWDNFTVKNKKFSRLQMVDGALYRLNKIKDFDFEVQATTEIELVKVLKAKKRKAIQLIDKEIAIRNTPNIASPNGVGEDVPFSTGGVNEVLSNSFLKRQ